MLDKLVAAALGVGVVALAASQYHQSRQLRNIAATLEGRPSIPDAATTKMSLPPGPISIDGAPLRGHRNASVVMIVYSDFQCPYCGDFARNVLPDLDNAYFEPGKVVLAFRHLPLQRIHANALSAAQAAVCAGDQRKFWEMHDGLFAAPGNLSTSVFTARAQELGMNMKAFDACLVAPTPQGLESDLASARALGITSTPTFLIGRWLPDGRVHVASRLSGTAPFEQFQHVLDAVISQQ